MIAVTIKINMNPDNEKELMQTISPLIDVTRKEKGCLVHNVYKDVENDSSLILVQEWESQEDLNRYLKSEKFGVLMGATHLLNEPPVFKFDAESNTIGMEDVRALRSS